VKWLEQLNKRPFDFSLDFHPIPYRGDPAGLDRHYLPRRGKAGPCVLTFFALEPTSRCLCCANANLTCGDLLGTTRPKRPSSMTALPTRLCSARRNGSSSEL